MSRPSRLHAVHQKVVAFVAVAARSAYRPPPGPVYPLPHLPPPTSVLPLRAPSSLRFLLLLLAAVLHPPRGFCRDAAPQPANGAAIGGVCARRRVARRHPRGCRPWSNRTGVDALLLPGRRLPTVASTGGLWARTRQADRQGPPGAARRPPATSCCRWPQARRRGGDHDLPL